jgi:hypothetical protein
MLTKIIIKLFSKLFSIIGILLILWCTLSFVEVNCKNMSENPQYSDLNLCAILVEVAENVQ